MERTYVKTREFLKTRGFLKTKGFLKKKGFLRKKRWLSVAAGFVMALSLLPALILNPANVRGDSSPMIRAGQAAGPRGATVDLPISVEGSAETRGGSFNVRYDPAALELLNASGIGTVNKKYAADTVRMSFASVSAVSGTVLTLTFRIKSDAAFGASPVTLSDARLYGENAEALTHTVQDGWVRAQVGEITLRPAKGVIGQAALVSIELTEDFLPAGGSFEVVYDSGTVTPIHVKASAMMGGRGFAANLAFSGNTVKITWAGGESLTRTGEICILSFRILEGVREGTSPLSVTNLRFYDENGHVMESRGIGASIIMETPESAVPSIVISRKVGEPFNRATAIVSARGSDTVFGGSLNIGYDPSQITFVEARSLSGTATVSATPQQTSQSDNVLLLAWASAIPSAKTTHLAEITFDISGAPAGVFPVTARNVVFYDENAEIIPGEAAIDLGIAAVGESLVIMASPESAVADAAASGAVTVNMAIDTVASPESAQGTSEKKPENVFVMMAVYDKGKMKGFTLKEVALDETATVEESVDVQIKGSADSCKVMVLNMSQTLEPLCENLQYAIGGEGSGT